MVVGALGVPSASAGVVSIDFDGDATSSGPVEALSWEGTAEGYLGNGMGVSIPRGSHWGLTRFEAVPDRPDEAWFRYMLRLDDWQASQAGKLPGPVGLASSSGRGCIRPNADRPGWSARMMYRAAGTAGAPAGQTRIGYYVYHLDQPRDCGEIMEWNDAANLQEGVWYCIEGHIKLNSPTRRDGVLDGWVDAVPAFTRADLRFRDTPSSHIDNFWMNVYSGGKPASPESLHLTLDEVVVSSIGRIGCPDAFVDDEADPNETAINQLAGTGAIEACRGRMVCPSQPMTRGETAAMVVRSLGLETSAEAKQKTRFGPELHAAAEAGLMDSCEGTCSDQTVTRSEFALIVARAFAFPDPGFGPFSDITDVASQGAIDALAAAGVTAGCGEGRFCPDLLLTRSDAAAMLARALDQEHVSASLGSPARRRPIFQASPHRPRLAGLSNFDSIHGR
jgi:hypothetical protein